MRSNYRMVLCDYLRQIFGAPKVGCEVGVWRGDTTNALLRAFPDLRLYAVDPWELGDPKNTTRCRVPEEHMRRAREKFFADTQWVGERLIAFHQTSLAGAARIFDSELDFAFIDGDHRYEAVRDDLHAWWPKIRVGGVLTGHDYRHAPRGRFGVIQAVNEFYVNNHYEFEMLDGTTYAICKF